MHVSIRLRFCAIDKRHWLFIDFKLAGSIFCEVLSKSEYSDLTVWNVCIIIQHVNHGSLPESPIKVSSAELPNPVFWRFLVFSKLMFGSFSLHERYMDTFIWLQFNPWAHVFTVTLNTIWIWRFKIFCWNIISRNPRLYSFFYSLSFLASTKLAELRKTRFLHYIQAKLLVFAEAT